MVSIPVLPSIDTSPSVSSSANNSTSDTQKLVKLFIDDPREENEDLKVVKESAEESDLETKEDVELATASSQVHVPVAEQFKSVECDLNLLSDSDSDNLRVSTDLPSPASNAVEITAEDLLIPNVEKNLKEGVESPSDSESVVPCIAVAVALVPTSDDHEIMTNDSISAQAILMSDSDAQTFTATLTTVCSPQLNPTNILQPLSNSPQPLSNNKRKRSDDIDTAQLGNQQMQSQKRQYHPAKADQSKAVATFTSSMGKHLSRAARSAGSQSAIGIALRVVASQVVGGKRFR